MLKKVWGVCVWPKIEKLNVGFNAFTKGNLGLQNTFNLNSGIVDALIPIDLFFDIPDSPVEAGEMLTIQSGFLLLIMPVFRPKVLTLPMI